MAASGNRGFKGVLLSSIFGQCEVPFQCAPHPIHMYDGNVTFVEIIDGYGQFAESLSSQENIKYDHKVYAKDRVIKGHNIDKFLSNIICIVEHFRDVGTALYCCPVTKIYLEFGVIEESGAIHLLDGEMTTAPHTYASYLFQNVPGCEETFVDFFVNAVLYNPGHERCYSDFPDCQKPRFKCKLLYIIYYCAKEQFPNLDSQKLYYLIKKSMNKVNANREVNVCINCVHLYALEKRDYQCEKRKYPRDKTQPYNCVLYEREPLPPPPKKVSAPQFPKPRPSSVIRKLASGEPTHTDKSRIISRSLKMKTKPVFIQPEFQKHDSMALKATTNLYGYQPYSRVSWNRDEIIRRFHKKSYRNTERPYIEPKNCHITKFMQ
ncbi:hypothetical protein TRFO_10346 [Tritrichomonas foetus]|uniref:Uncharacterized protein n=1 Tax=Tritrichomonas foetus TaxID=1144522 RepID=A0A1J4JEM0_9EUKA|nr:hypothetical protein TRFO_10346 [Tritrichomonas foetus]|eukprot:OHS95708.1 hypothetical protein TRFO_10346 [Tritrichomonas foetus]